MSDRFRILHLRTSNFVGGPERQLLRYGEHERAGPLELIFGTIVGETEGRDFGRAVEKCGLPLLTLRSGSMGDTRALSSLMRYVGEHSIALICTHGYQADVLGTLTGLLCKIPVAWFLRGWTGEDWKVQIYEKLDRTLLPLATRVVCLSHTQANQLAVHRSLARKIRVVHNAVEVQPISAQERLAVRRKLRIRLGLKDEALVVATAGRLSPEKGTAHFLLAIRMMQRRLPSAHFVVFGNGPLKPQLEETAQKLGLGTTLRFAGFVPDFPELLPGIDVLVNPSLSEVMPNVVLESMAAGVPVVATEVGSVREISGEDGCIVLVPSKNSDAIANAVTGLLEDPDRVAQVSQAGQRRIQEVFSSARQRSQLRALYGEMIPGLSWTHGVCGDVETSPARLN